MLNDFKTFKAKSAKTFLALNTLLILIKVVAIIIALDL